MKIIRHSKYRSIFYLLIFFISAAILSSCIKETDPYYPAKKIPEQIIKICKNEYNLNVKVDIVEDTLWLYIPIQRFVDQSGNVDKEFIDTLNHVVLSINRVIMSTKAPPKFYAILASDTKDIGADYLVVGYILDVKKYLYNFISREEFLRRQVIKFGLNPKALGDEEGLHLPFFNMSLAGFIFSQIEQRIAQRFDQDSILSKFKLEKVKAIPEDNNIKFVLDIKGMDKFRYDVDFTSLALKIIAEVFFAYDFNDFDTVSIEDSYSGKFNTYNRKSLEDFR